MEWIDYLNVNNLLNNMELAFVGTITDISFDVYSIRGDWPLTDSKKEDRLIYTLYDIAVQTSYKGESKSELRLRCLGGLKDYKVEEQLKVVKEKGTWGDCIHLVEDMPKYEIGETYLFLANQRVNGTVANGNPYQCVYNLHNPFEERSFGGVTTANLKDIISAFGKDKWDTFWTQWQKDNPKWETWIDKSVVERALSE